MTAAVGAAPGPAAATRVSAIRHPGFRAYFIVSMLAMMADNIEHVISYWVAFEKFHSAALGGFAVVSHWLPFLLFAIPSGGLADRFDPRRLIQIAMALFMAVSITWATLIVTDSLQLWQAMVLLVVHGLAGVLWAPSAQVLIYDIVGPSSLPSAVRLAATARYLGMLVGPGIGALIMETVGPRYGLYVNALFYLPMILWLWHAPYGPLFRAAGVKAKRAVTGFADVFRTLRDVAGNRALVSMMLLAGAASCFVGNAYHAQMPNFARGFGLQDADMTYSMLLGADACGALLAGVMLEKLHWLSASPRVALMLGGVWAIALGSFALVASYPAALALLFLAGFVELSFSSAAQTIVQLNAPDAVRGRVIGVYSMAASGMRTFSGLSVGLLGSLIGIHASLAASAATLLAVIVLLVVWFRVDR